jgi:peptidoglycan-associated lipoprotein
MTMVRSGSRRDRGGPVPVALVALSLLAAGSPANGAEPSPLQLFHGRDDTWGMSLKNLRVVLDGKDLGVPLPAADADPERPLLSRMIEPGVHNLEVEASLEAASSTFSYMDGYGIKLRAALEVEALAGRGIAIRSQILPKGGITTQWSERNKLVLTLSAVDGPTAPAVAVATARPPTPAPLEAPPSPQPEREPRAARDSGPEDAPMRAADDAPPAPRAEPDRATGVAAAAPPAAAERSPAPPSTTVPAPRPAPEPAPGVADECRVAALRFQFDQASLPDDARETLARFASCVAATRFDVRVEGHSDSRGGDEYNRWLAWDRAASVSAYLRQHGVADRRITTRSQGARRPLCRDASEDCFARNRRVEVIVAR